MIWVIVAVLAYFLFFNKSSTVVSNNFTVTGGGGTSTPTPTPQIPAFYQASNSAPTSADNPNPVPVISPKFNILTSPGQLASRTSAPDITTSGENSSVGTEQNTSYANNGVGTGSDLVRVGSFGGFGGSVQPIIAGVITISNTVDSPDSVGTPPAGTGLAPAATIAPNPPSNPTFEATVPQIASAVVKASLTQDNSTSLLRQRAFV